MCVVNLYDIKWSDENDCYAWQLRDIRPVVPFPVKGKLHLYDVDDNLINLANKKSDIYLFDWWQFDLEIIKEPVEKKVNKPKQAVTKKAKVEEPKREVAKKRRPRLRSIY